MRQPFLLALLVAATFAAGPAVSAILPQDGDSAKGVHSDAFGQITFSFKDPKGVNAIGFFVDSELEPITGFATGIVGRVIYNPAKPKAFSGSVSFGADRIECSNRRMSRVLAGADWLNVDQHGDVSFRFHEVEAAERVDERTVRLTVKGALEVRGASIPKTVEVTAAYIRDGAARRGGAEAGDLLVLRSKFSIDRTDFGIKPESSPASVGHEIHINVAIVGYSQG